MRPPLWQARPQPSCRSRLQDVYKRQAVPGVILALGLDPTDLADGLVQILHLPSRFVYGGLAGMRMFTLLQDDWRALGQSRRSRGLGDGSAIKRVFSQAFSLLVVSIRRGTKLATAIDVYKRQEELGVPMLNEDQFKILLENGTV